MSTLALQSYIGQTALLVSDKLRFAVRIVDAKLAYGQTRLLVEPINGIGQVWVDIARIQLDGQAQVRDRKEQKEVQS